MMEPVNGVDQATTAARPGPSGKAGRAAWRRVATASLLSAAILSIYAGKLSGPFLFDDEQTITANRTIKSLWPPWPVLQPPRDTPVAGRPVVNLSFAVNYALTGPDRLWFHAFNLGLHFLAALLAWSVLRRILTSGRLPEWIRERSEELAALSALLWCVHPLAVEVVLYTSQRTESCVALFYLLTAYCVLRASETRQPLFWSLAAVAACALGMGAKSVMVTAPVLIFFLDRAFVSGSFAETLKRRRWLYGGLASTWIILLALELDAPRSRSVRFLELDYLAAQSRIVLEYLSLSVWPDRLISDFGPLMPTQAGLLWLTIPICSALVIGSAVLAFTHPRAGFPAAWVFGILAPSSSLVSIVTEVGAERRMYLPLIALVALAVVAVHAVLIGVFRRFSLPRDRAFHLLVVVTLTAAFALGARARARADDFQSTLAFWQSAEQGRPQNPRAHYNLAETRRRLGRAQEAIAGYRRAIVLNESYAEAHLNLGGMLMVTGGPELALPHIRRGAELSPRSASAQFDLGVALGLLGRFREAESALEKSLAIDPSGVKARLKLAYLLFRRGRDAEAIEHLNLIQRRHPGHPEAVALSHAIRETDSRSGE